VARAATAADTFKRHRGARRREILDGRTALYRLNGRALKPIHDWAHGRVGPTHHPRPPGRGQNA
jgi:hypothetical protein